jgi:8-oxo-dGTP diphosphatase
MTTNNIIKYAALIQNSNGEILLARKSGKNIWINIGGKVEINETAVDCLKREICEELNCEISESLVPTLFLESPYTPALDDPGKLVKIIWYKVELVGQPKPSSEIEEIRWINPKNPQVELSPQIKEFLLPKLNAAP